MEAAQIASTQSPGMCKRISFNNEQCKYLAHKLRRAMFFANWFFDFEFPRSMFATPEYQVRCLELSRTLFLLAKEVVCFIQGCSKEPWIQAAVMLSNMSDHVLSLGFDLELCAISFTSLTSFKCLRFHEVSDLRIVEARIAEEKAARLDHGRLLTKVKALIQPGQASTDEYELATFLFQRLISSPRPLSSPLGRFEPWAFLDFNERSNMTKLKQMVKIGTGAFGTVHKAIWRGVDVAVKTFHGPENADFKKEVSICTRLSHPNIVSFLFCGVDYGECSIVMELMDEDLRTLIRTRLRCNRRREPPFCMFVALDLMLQIGEGLCYLHEMRIVHGDLKSHNILVRRKKSTNLEGHECVQAKVADFGLSRTKENSRTYSNPTPNMGTLRWMAPEMFGHESMVVKERYPFKSDVYSFAMVCYEILTGNFPFQAIHSYMEVKNKVISGERPRLPRQCPMELKTLIEKCWSQEASARPCFSDICKLLRYVKSLQMSGKSRDSQHWHALFVLRDQLFIFRAFYFFFLTELKTVYQLCSLESKSRKLLLLLLLLLLLGGCGLLILLVKPVLVIVYMFTIWAGTSEVLTSVAHEPPPSTTGFVGSIAYKCLLESFKQKLQELLVIYSYNIPLEKFVKVYRLRFQEDLNPQYLGETSLSDLLQKVHLSSFITNS